MILLPFMTENRQFHSFIIVTMILTDTHDLSAMLVRFTLVLTISPIDRCPMPCTPRLPTTTPIHHGRRSASRTEADGGPGKGKIVGRSVKARDESAPRRMGFGLVLDAILKPSGWWLAHAEALLNP
jgi:hypothetical protein